MAEALPQLGFPVEIPFVRHLGFAVRRFDGGHSELAYEARPEHMNSNGVTHGGASMTLMDVAMAMAARSVQQDMGVVTIEMKTSFMQAARGKLTAKGHLLQRTGKMAFVEGHIWDDQDRLCAHATGTFKYVFRTAAAADGTGSAGVIPTD